MTRLAIVAAALATARPALGDEPAQPAGAVASTLDGTTAAAAAPHTDGDRPPVVGDQGVFRLRTGGTLAGELVAHDASGDRLRLVSGEVVELAPGSLTAWVGPHARAEYVAPRPGGPRDPARTRHVQVPSAFGPDDRGLVVAATGVEAGLSYGWTRWLATSVGVAGPLVLGTTLPVPAATAGVDLHRPIGHAFHARVGVRGYASSGEKSLLATAAVTFDASTFQLTLYGGPSIPGAARLGSFDATVVGIAGTVRMTRAFAASLEGWASPRAGSDLAGAAALRWLSTAWAVDAGGIVSERELFPWIAVTWTRPTGGAR